MNQHRYTSGQYMSLEELQRWLRDDLFDQVNSVIFQRETFKSWNDMMEIASVKPRTSGFRIWVDYNYIQALAVAIRRICDEGRYSDQTASFHQFLKKVGEYAHNEGIPNMPQEAREDRKLLKEKSKRISQYANKYIAHLDQDRRDWYTEHGRVTLGEFHNAVETIVDMYRRWFGKICSTYLEIPFRTPWEFTFSDPWITTDQAAAIVARRDAEGASRSSAHVVPRK